MEDFGRTEDGRQTWLYCLENDRWKIEVTDYGASMVSFVDKEAGIDIVQGYTDVTGYEKHCPYMGAIVGRVCNRIKDGKFVLNGTAYHLEQNDRGNCLHSGSTSTCYKVWKKEEDPDVLAFTCFSPDGEGGFPGNVTMRTEYRLDEEGLEITLSADTDADTYIAMTNHAYFNLNGPQSDTILDQELMLDSDVLCCIDENGQTGEETIDVTGTPFDFRTFKEIGKDIGADDVQLHYGGGYDHCFIVRGDGYRHAAAVRTDRIRMDVFTDLPALQVYTGNFLTGEGTGKEGGNFPRRSAVCLEAQYVPDAMNSSCWDKPLVKAGEKLTHVIRFRTEVR